MATRHRVGTIEREIVTDEERDAERVIASRLRRLYHPEDYTTVNARNILGDLRDAGFRIVRADGPENVDG